MADAFTVAGALFEDGALETASVLVSTSATGSSVGSVCATGASDSFSGTEVGDCVTASCFSTGGFEAFAFGTAGSGEDAAAEDSAGDGAGLVGDSEASTLFQSNPAAGEASFSLTGDSPDEVAEAGTNVPANARAKTIPALSAKLEMALCDVPCFLVPQSKEHLPERPLFRRATLSPTGLPNTRIPQYPRTLGMLNLKNADWCVEFDARFPKTSAKNVAN
ncbi:hypothetical protein [Glutamicibacter mysorens]|uniref:hypothetical protein n=1 Tax=Glutamicibacter mysorens TaxID=257984 RepID=UPI0020C67D39|nr:hypothetical protein [Glutamicibacter mysorens]UTM47564.1 hypothetical protein XH9_01705 [Glutamicibacter mysorens]